MNEKKNGTSDERQWSMRAVSQRTGLSEHTLRAWEKRFGFPSPVRLESGHRRYPTEQVQRLTAIQSALVRGHRIGDVIGLDEAQISSLLSAQASPVAPSVGLTGVSYIDACRRLDTESLASMLRRDAAELGISRFLLERLVPFIHTVGYEWAEGTISIRHEHLSSETVEGVLRELRTPLEKGLSGRPILMATLPGEQHSLGMQIVALLSVSRGQPVRIMGTETPPEEIATSAETLAAVSVAISLTDAGVNEESIRDLTRLRADLPADVALWIGGEGTRRLEGMPTGIRAAHDLEDVDDLVADARARNRNE